MPNRNHHRNPATEGADRLKIRRKKLKEKVGDVIWYRYTRSVERGLLTQKEADAAMLVEHQKAVTKANRERKANGPRPKSKHTRHREHAEKMAEQKWAERKHTSGHRAHRNGGQPVNINDKQRW